MKEEVFDRLKGAFWGLVVGDCLGSPIQFMGKDEHPYITEMEPCETFGTPPGYWTDDSAMAFCVAESFVRLGKADVTDIGNNFVKWYRNGFWSSLKYAFDIGGATSVACTAIECGCYKNGIESSQGNGSIMRFAPSYIIARGMDEERGRQFMHDVSDLTHKSERVRNVIDKFAEILDDHIGGKCTTVKSTFSTREEVNNSGWAVSTLDAALWAFHTTSTFEEALIAAVNLGGDADSIGAVCGQIAGAIYGYSSIPERWLAAVKDREKVNSLIESTCRI